MDLDAGEEPRHTETKRRHCLLHCSGTAQAQAVDSGDDCDYVPRLAGALPRVTAQRDQGAAPYFHSLVTAPGLPSADTAPLSPRTAHFTGELNWNPRRRALSILVRNI